MQKHKLVLALIFYTLTFLSQAEGLLSISNPAKNSQNQALYTTVEAFEGNDSVAMRQYGTQWLGIYSPHDDTNIGLLSARVETGVQWDGLRLGALYRAEALVQASRDTTDLAQQYNTRQGYDQGRSYGVDYRIKGFEALGARLSKTLPFNPTEQWALDIGVGVSYLQGKSLKLETASGQIVTINTKDFDASVNTNKTNSNTNVRDPDQFTAPYGRLASPSGQGYALDAGLVLRHKGSGISAELAVADLAGRINWTNVPSNATDYKTATKYYDTDGFVNFNPAVTRISSYQNVSQNLDPKVWLALNYAFNQFELQGASSYTAGYWFPQAGIKYLPKSKWMLGADYDFRFKTVAVSMQYQWLQVSLRTDNSNLDAAKAFGVTAGITVPF